MLGGMLLLWLKHKHKNNYSNGSLKSQKYYCLKQPIKDNWCWANGTGDNENHPVSKVAADMTRGPRKKSMTGLSCAWVIEIEEECISINYWENTASHTQHTLSKGGHILGYRIKEP